MKKIFLSVVGFSMICHHAFSQIKDTSVYKEPASLYTPVLADTGYNPHKLRLDEVNLVSSYYSQNGNHSPVTGGIGTEKVTDISNGIDLKFVWYGDGNRKNTLSAGLGFDVHTSASQAYVSATGASKKDGTRIYPSLDWTVEGKKGSFGIGTYVSTEYNYNSFGADVHFSRKVNHNNGEFTVKMQAYLDNVTLIYPSELIPTTTTVTSTGTVITTTASGRTISSGGSSGGGKESNIPTSPRNTYTGSLSYSQMLNSRLQVAFMVDLVKQDGFLSLPFHRVYFTTGKDTIERLPSTRAKLPLGFRLNYFLGDNIIIRSYYRYYTDDWGIKSNTANIEVPYKITPFFSISPFYRYYDQTAAKYFAPYEAHKPTDEYYTSNYAYSKFSANFYGVGFRIAPPKGVLGWQNLHELEIRYGHYSQTTDLVSDVISMSLGFK
jgi:hypothetical protein